MPSRNLEKIYAPEAYYHIYNRGVEERVIFTEKEDYVVFLSLLKRYLSKEPAKDIAGREYPNYFNDIKLLAFCLMPNHFHMLVYQEDKDAITKLLRSVCTSYTMYFNKKYKRVGPLFQGRFKASMITEDSYLLHISRYIHLNPAEYKSWEFSSLPYYLGQSNAEWINGSSVLELFSDGSYIKFLEDYEDHRKTLKDVKALLANS